MDGRAIRAVGDGRNRGALWLAVGGVLALFFGLTIFNNQPIEDEVHHLAGVQWYCDGHRAQPGFLPMLPGYHLFVLMPAMFCEGPARLIVLRAVNACVAVGIILTASAILRRLRVEPQGDALLHVAWNPLLFPFLTLVYTDGPALFCLMLAVYLHLRRRMVSSAIALLGACLVRQANLAWVAFMAAWALLDLWEQQRGIFFSAGRWVPRALLIAVAKRVWPHCLVGAAIVAILSAGDGPVPGGTENQPELNPAQFYLFGVCVATLWLPVWIECFIKDWKAVYWRVLMRAWACTYVIAAPALLVREYYNPHRWNRFLDDWKNWALIGMTHSCALRVAVATGIALVIPVVVRFVLAQPRRRLLTLTWVWGLLFLLPHCVADVRYYIVPVVLVNLFTEYTRAQARRLTVWYGLMSAAIGVSACVYGDRTGGIW